MPTVKAGTFAANTSTGNQAITGVGFQPKALGLSATRATAVGASATSATFGSSNGLGTGSANRVCVSITQIDNSNTGQVGWSESSIIQVLNSDGTVYAKADLVSLDSDGFTINWTTAPGAAITVLFRAIGGSDVTNAKVATFNANTSGSNPVNQAVTGVGFQPDFLEFLTGAQTAETIASANLSAAGPNVGRGAATSSSAMFAIQHGASTPAVVSTDCVYTLFSKHAKLASMDSDGFTLTWQPAGTVAYHIAYLALKGGHYFVGTDTENTTNANKAKTGVGFLPGGVFFVSDGGQAATPAYSSAVGFADSPTSRWSLTTSIKSVNPVRGASDYETTSVLKYFSDAAGTITQKGLGDLVSLDSDGYTLSWASTDGTARVFGVEVFGSTAGAPANSVAPSIAGTATVGQTLTGADGTWTNTPTSYARQWYRDNAGGGTYSAIGSATGTTYVLVDADDGCNIKYGVIATNASGSSSEVRSAAVGLVIEPVATNSVAPTISGSAPQGSTLTCNSNGTWAHMGGTVGTYTYQWTRAGSNITGATASTYQTRNADVGSAIGVKVTATNTGGASSAVASSNTVTPTTAGFHSGTLTAYTVMVADIVAEWVDVPAVAGIQDVAPLAAAINL